MEYLFMVLAVIPLTLVLKFLIIKNTGNLTQLPSAPGRIPVPKVRGGWPIFGHVFWIYWNPLRFLKDCENTYGSAFVLDILGKQFMIICDHTTAGHLLNKPEDEFSFEEALVDFIGVNYEVGLTANVFRSSLRFKSDQALPLMQKEIDTMLNQLRTRFESTPQHRLLLRDFMSDVIRCMARVNYSCFMGKDLTDQNLDEFQNIFWWIQSLTVARNLLPKFLFEWSCLAGIATRSHNQMIAYAKKLIQDYSEEAKKSELKLIPEADVMNDSSIWSCLIISYFLSAASFHVAIFEAINHLAQKKNAQFLRELREECKSNYGRPSEIMKGPLLHACVMESARLGSTLINNVRKPMRSGLSLGKYFIGPEIDWVGLSTPMIMEHGKEASAIFKNPGQFNPYRFVGKKKESLASRNLVAWGSGVHLCPAKGFSIQATKLFMAAFVKTFEFELGKGKGDELVISSYKTLDIFITNVNK